LNFTVKIFFTIIVIFISLHMFPSSVSGQPDEDLRIELADKSLKEAIQMYDRRIGQNTFIYSGRIYNENDDGIRGHPYFYEDYGVTGRITYQEMVFDSLELRYEIVHDQLLLDSYNNQGRLALVILNNRNIKNFELHGHTFVFLKNDPVINLREGFYDVIYCGTNIEIYAKRKKEIIKKTIGNDMWEEFREKNIFYLKKEKAYNLVKNRITTLKILDEHRKELKAYIKSNNIDFRADMEGALIKIASWFESL
jgi:hypothetical protein